MTNHFLIFILYNICSYKSEFKRSCWVEESNTDTDEQECWHLWLCKLGSATAGNHSRRRLVVQQLEDVFDNAFLPVSHCQERQLLYLVTIPCMFSSSLGSIINIVFLFLRWHSLQFIKSNRKEGRFLISIV